MLIAPPHNCHVHQQEMQRSRARTERLWKDYLKDPSQWWDNRKSKTNPTAPDFKHKLTQEWLWMDGSHNPSWVKDRLVETEEPCAIERIYKAQDDEKQVKNSYTGNGGGWRMFSLEEAMASLEEGSLLPQLSIEDFARILHRCRKEKDRVQALLLHAYMCKTGLEAHRSLGNYLVSMLVEVGSMHDAQQVFDMLVYQNEWSWNSLITGYISCGKPQHALALYQKMRNDDSVHITGHTFVALLKACAKLKDLQKGLEIHAEVAMKGLLKTDLFVGNTLVDMYAKCGSLSKAQQVFDELLVRDVVSWTALIAGYAEHGHGEEALKCFQQMRLEGVSPNAVTFVCSLKACGSIGATDKGQELHAEIERKGLLERDLAVGNTLVDMYAKCGLLAKAQQVFDKLPFRDVVSWTALIAGYAEYGDGEEALKCFEQMQHEGVSPNTVTFACSLKACGSIGATDKGGEIHAQIERKGFLERDLVVGNTLVDMYSKCGLLTKAQEVFNKLPVRNVVAWTTLIAGYADHGHDEEALKCFEQMQLEGISPDALTLVCSLKACGSMGAMNKGQEIHAEIDRKGFLNKDLFVGNTLVNMYAKCGSLAKAQEVFDKLPIREVVSWTALIVGYFDHGHGAEALKCFEKMQLEGVPPNAVTFVCSLKACGSIGATNKGREIHAEIERKGLLETVFVIGNTLVDMYIKCGSLVEALKVFDKLLVRNIVSWNALIAGYAEHELGEEAVRCFEQMQLEGVPPDALTFICSLKACSSIKAIDKGQELHAEIEKKGLLERDLVGNTLVDMYAKCGSLAIAQQVFNRLPVQDVVSWNALITGYAEHGLGKAALECFEQMQLRGVSPNVVTFVGSLKACGSIGATDKGQEIHAEIDRKGLLERNLVVGNTLIDMYAKCGFLAKAQEVFDKLPVYNVISWTALIAGYAEHGHGEEALKRFEQMQVAGVSPNAVTFVCSLKACSIIGATDKGQEIHAEIERKGIFERDLVVGNTLVDMYAKCGLLAKAQEVFDKLPVRNVLSWTTLIAGYAEHGYGEEALKFFEHMQLEGMCPDALTFVCSLKACGAIGAIDKGQEIHAEIERKGLVERDLVAGNALVDMYARCGSLAIAQQVFDKLPVRDIVSWNALITGYAEHGHAEEALKCFEQMQLMGVSPDVVTFVCSLKACGSIGATDKGQEIHAEIERKGLLERDLVGNTLVDMYAKCDLLAKAEEVFDKLPIRNVVSWTALIAGYAEHGHGEEALKCFEHMQLEGVPPNPVTCVSSLKACGSIGAIDKGREIHADIETKGFWERDVVGNILVDMYAKCGSIVEAQEVFDKLPVGDVVSYNALITGYSQLGESENVFHTFDRMLAEGIKPNLVTFVIVLSACGRTGLFDKSQTYFEAMNKDYGIAPTLEHITIMVDLLCRTGQLDNAVAMIKKMPFCFNLVAWHSMLSVCRDCGNVELGRQVFEHAVRLDDKDAAAYVLMSHIYAGADHAGGMKQTEHGKGQDIVGGLTTLPKL